MGKGAPTALMQNVEAGMGAVNEAAPALAVVTAVAGWMAHRGRRAGWWLLLRDMVRGRTAVRAERERRHFLVELADRLPPGGRLVVREHPGGRSSVEVHSPLPAGTANQDTR